MKERTSAHDTIKTTGLKRFAEDCGVYAKVEPSELHPEDTLRRVDLVVSFPEGNVLGVLRSVFLVTRLAFADAHAAAAV